VPNNIEASWAALPPPGRSSSESSSLSSLSEPQSSVSARRRETGAEGGLASWFCVILWKGFVAEGAGAAGAGALSFDWDIILKNGFLLSVSLGGDVTTVGGAGGDETASAGGGEGFLSSSWLATWLSLLVGVEA
jgi:hypothetical protein